MLSYRVLLTIRTKTRGRRLLRETVISSGAPPLLIRFNTSAATIPTGGGRSDLSRVPHIIALQCTGEILHCIKYGKGLTNKWIDGCLTG